MSLTIPREMKGFQFDRLCYLELNNFEIEMLLPALFWLVRANGRDRAGQNAPSLSSTIAPTIQSRAIDLARHQRMKGFNTEDGHSLIDKWVRSSLVSISQTSRRRDGERISYVRPLSFLTYKPKLGEGSRLRKTQYFLYHLCRDYVARDNSRIGYRRDDYERSARAFDESIQSTFAEGLTPLRDEADKRDTYDGETPLDLETLLQIFYLDGFVPPKEKKESTRKVSAPSCYRAASNFARDFTTFLEVYSGLVSPAVLTRYLLCLLNFEFLTYTLRLAKATNRLVSKDEIPAEFRITSESKNETPLELYVDLTQLRGSRSDQIANACVNRDIEDFESYFRSALTLRMMERFLSRQQRALFEEKKSGPFILDLFALKDDVKMQARAAADIETLREQFLKDGEEIMPPEVKAIFDDTTMDDVSCLAELLVLGQRKNGVGALMKWFGDVGGKDRDDGILRGNVKGRRVWRYVMSDTLLETLVQLAAIDPEVRERSHNRITGPIAPGEISLPAFLDFLSSRFGLLIDTPPAFDQSVEATAAAKENYAALKQRLQQMGMFPDMSDDFNAQRITPRFCPETETAAEFDRAVVHASAANERASA